MGNQGQGAELAQFLDIERVELAPSSRGGNLSTSEDRDTLSNLYEKHLVATLHNGGWCLNRGENPSYNLKISPRPQEDGQ